MPSTYTVNLGIEKPGTGEQSGTWGDTTNTNFDILDQAINGAVSITLGSAGTSGSPNTLAITDGATSNGRNKWIEFTDGGDLGATAYVQLTPNDAEKIVFFRNSLSGSRSVIVFQGTYNASNDFEIPAGKDVVLKFDGGGTGATVTQVFVDLKVNALTGNVTGDLTGDVTSAGTSSFATVTVSGTVDGRDVSVDGTKLDTIETNADVTDTANVTAAGALMDSELTNIAAVKALNQGVSTTDDVTFGTVTADGLTVSTAENVVATFNSTDTTSAVDITDDVSTARVMSTNGDFRIQADPSNTESNSEISLWTDGDQRLRISPNGDISFYEDTGTTAKVFWDASAERLGIGTSSPSAQLHLESGLGVPLKVNSSDSTLTRVEIENTSATEKRTDIAFISNSSTKGTVGFNGSNIEYNALGSSEHVFELDAVEAMRINSSGKVGIGVSSNLGGALTLPHQESISFHDASGSARRCIEFDSGELLHGSAGAGLNTQTFYTSGSEAVRIDSSGNIGIGTSNPSAKLHVASGGSPENLELKFDTGAGATTANFVDFNHSRSLGNFTFSFAGSEVARIDSSGNVGIGTTTPVYPLDVRSSDSQLLFGQTDATSGSMVRLRANDGLDDIFEVSASGNVGIGTSSPVSELTVNGNILAPWSNQGTYEIGVAQRASNVFSTSTNELVLKGADGIAGTQAMGGGDVRVRGGKGVGSVAGTAGNVIIQGGAAASGASATPGYIAFEVGQTSTEAARIDSSGNVGIGTSSPASLLQVLGSFGLSKAAMSSSSTGGDFTISISGLTGLTGGSWRQAAVLVCYSGVNPDQTNPTMFLSIINILGLSTWGISSTSNITGTASATASSGTSSSVNLNFNVSNGNVGHVFALVIGSGGNISISG